MIDLVTAHRCSGGMAPTAVTRVHLRGVLMQVISVMPLTNVLITIWSLVHWVQARLQQLRLVNVLQQNIG